jgi:hypothetical protein
MLFRTKMAAIAAIPALALIAPAALSTAPAHASVPAKAAGAASRIDVPDTLGPVVCNGNTCVQSQCAHCDVQSIRAWANSYGFTGHFEIVYGCSVAGCTTQNSNNQYWRAGGTGYTFHGVPAAAISATVNEWQGGPPWTKISDVGFYL